MTTLTGQHVYELLQVRSADLGRPLLNWWALDDCERTAWEAVAVDLDRLTEPVGRAQ